MSKLDEFKEYIIAPGETIKELLESNSMTQLDLAKKSGITKKTINEIIQGKAPITNATALKFEYIFNIPASFFNNLESNYKDALERQNDAESIKKEEKYLDEIPYNTMEKLNYPFITKTSNKSERVINLRKFFGVASLDFNTQLQSQAAFRKSTKTKSSPAAISCWIRYGEIESNKETYPTFNIDKLKDNSFKIRKLSNKTFTSQQEEIKKILKESGVSLVYAEHLPNTSVNGATFKMTSNKAVIMLSDRGKKDDILWFTLFHEIGHLLKHSRKDIFIDSDNDNKNSIEKEADRYAENILIPSKEYNSFLKNKNISKENILLFSKENNITPGILIGRLQKDNIIPWNSELNSLKSSI